MLVRGWPALLFIVACGGTAPVDEPGHDGARPSAHEAGAVRDEPDGALDTPDGGRGESAHDPLEAGAPTERDGGPAPTLESYVGLYENASGLPLVDLLDAARRALDLELYEMHDAGVHAALRRALARGVRVRVVAEPAPIGSSCRPFEPLGASESTECVRIKNLIADVRAAGGSYEPFRKEALCATPSRCVQHGKLIVFDRRVALVSTGNFNATSLCTATGAPDRCNRDYTVVSDHAGVVSTLVSVFEADLAGQSYDLSSVLAGEGADELTVSPLARAPLLSFIASAERSIHIANQYFHEPELNAALVAAAERGVRVELLVASFCAFGQPSSGDIAEETAIFESFEQAGIQSRVFSARQLIGGAAGYLHAKAIVVDEERAWVGSVNGSVQATTQNREFGLFFGEPAWVLALTNWLEGDFRDANGESWRESLACTKDR